MLMAAAVALAGCGGGEEPTPTPTKTPAAGAEQPATPTPPPADAQGDAQAGSQPLQSEQPVEVAQPTATPVVERMAAVATDLLNIRSEPNTSATIVQTAATGEAFVVVGESDDGLWLQLAKDGTPVGWAAAEFLTVEERAVSGPSGDAGSTAGGDQAGGAPVAGPALPATMTSPDYGVQAFLWWRPEIAENDLTLVKNGGFNWVKQTFAWETIEGAGRGQFDWTISDRVVRQVNDKGLKLLARLSIDPEETSFWAGPPPQNADAFAEYAGALAARYNCQPGSSGCIHAFQIWNEPNLAREWGGKRPNPAEYAAFLKKAYAAIKAGNPNAIVINAGMAPTGDDSDAAMPDDKFYDQMYQAMGGNSTGYFDALGVHGAGYAAPPELDPAEAASSQKYGGYRFFSFRHVEDIRAIMEKYGDVAKKIVLLEFGWTSDDTNPAYKWHGRDAGIDDTVKADYLQRAFEFARTNWPWIGLMSVITMPNADWLNDGDPTDEEQFWWAIMEPSTTPETRWRASYMVLCIYLNGLRGQQCQYAPQ
jgi:polysaccharide biosynthesis protein PslG